LTSCVFESSVLIVVGIPNSVRVSKRREATRREIVDAAWAVAREVGLTGLTLRLVAERVGMQPPSLYSHFESKDAIYDAMFADAWNAYLNHLETSLPRLPDDPRRRLHLTARHYAEFATADLARHLIMDVRSIPDFAPSEAAYAVAVECFEHMRRELARTGVTRDADIDMYTALISGVVSQQLANDPGGDRWLRLLPRMVDMYADAVGIPPSSTRRTRRSTKGSAR
jgi:AcrR family transcriptional regulator